MKNIEFQLKNFKNFKKTTKVSFEWNTVHLIFGVNGSGKTNFSRYIENCLKKNVGKTNFNCKECNECSYNPEKKIENSKIAVFNNDYLDKLFIKSEKFNLVVFENTEERKKIIELDDKIKEQENILREKIEDFKKDFLKDFNKELIVDNFLKSRKLLKRKLLENSGILKHIVDYLKKEHNVGEDSNSVKVYEDRIKMFLNEKTEVFEQRQEIIALNISNWKKNNFEQSEFKFHLKRVDQIEKNVKKILNLLKKQTGAQKEILEKLFKFTDFRVWISQFFELHKKHKQLYNTECPLCGGKTTLSKKRIKNLEEYNKDFANILEGDEISSLKGKCDDWFAELEKITDKNTKLLETFDNSNAELKELKIKIKRINTNLENLREFLENLSTLQIDNLRKTKKELLENINEYWKDFKNTFLEIQSSKAKTVFNSFFKNDSKINNLQEKIQLLKKEDEDIMVKVKKRNKLKTELQNDTQTPLREINNHLLNFFELDIRLRKDNNDGIYKIQKKVDDEYVDLEKKNISEGEKMIIGLIYFQTKLIPMFKHKSNKIIVIDDPSSSLTEENKWKISLFLSKNIIKENASKKNILFILSHDKSFLAQIYRKIKQNKNFKKAVFKIHKSKYKDKFSKEEERFLDRTNKPELEHLKQCFQEKKYNCVANLMRKIGEGFKENSIKIDHDVVVKEFINLDSHKNNLRDYIDEDFIVEIMKKWTEKIKKSLPSFYNQHLKDIIKDFCK